MKARVAYIGDYDEQSKTCGIGLIADESEIDKAAIKEGDEVDVSIIGDGAAYSWGDVLKNIAARSLAVEIMDDMLDEIRKGGAK